MTQSETQSGTTRLRHILVIDDEKGRRAVGLEAATYSIGRDPTNAIVLDGEGVSRQHAILLRVPAQGYRLIDGNSAGKPSLNGVYVNGESCSSRDLVNQDRIRFGTTVEAQYCTLPMSDADYLKYTQAASFRSIKSEMVDRIDTLISN